MNSGASVNRVRPFALLTLLALLALPSGAAQSAEISAAWPPTAEGQVGVEATVWALRLPRQDLSIEPPEEHLNPSGGPGLRFSLRLMPAAPSSVLVVENRAASNLIFRGPSRGALPDDVSLNTGQGRETFRVQGEARLDVVCEENCLVLIVPAREGGRIASGPARSARSILDAPDEEAYPVRVPSAPPYDWVPEGPVVHWSHAGGPLTVSGAFDVAIWSARATLTSDEGEWRFDTGERAAPALASGSSARAGANFEMRERRLLVLRADGVEGVIAGVPPGEAILTATDPTYRVDGRINFDATLGVVEYDGTQRRLDGAALGLTGTFLVSPVCRDPDLVDQVVAGDGAQDCAYRVEGRIDRVAVAGHVFFDRPSLAATAAALGLAGAIAGFQAAGARLYTRVPPRATLAHPARRLIHERVRRSNGIHFKALSRLTGLSPGSLSHHLRILETNKYVRSESVGAFRVYWAAGHGCADARVRAYVALASERARRYARQVLEHPGLTQTELARMEQDQRASARYHLAKLVDAGLARAEPSANGRGFRYFPMPELSGALVAAAQGELARHGAPRGEAASAGAVASEQPARG